MWPWGHLAFAYVLYSSLSRLWNRGPPSWPGVALVVVGSQMPDLVDKPLAWTFGVLPSGRSFAHSLLAGTVIVILVVSLLSRLDVPSPGAFVLGYYSHLLGDSYQPILAGNYQELAFLLWPVLPLDVANEPTVGILHYLLNARLDGQMTFELGLAAAVVLWWILDGAPGVAETWTVVRRRVGQATK
ncbi:metal-dependent hydrolase [Halogeometricum limi]|uniref:LexA-binding, inner membrane-associated putative hydrolase n=1 Tax=Halogeometricum limi TaxID=555875 RepID=A0A1I6G2Z5_9EURY|nr:metal-dependent hydrolase [Halogeometricum limi]SFR36549.1 LexA-binding, inner membrane-associated putative hydrolase [Halogeometricum limi]